MSFRKISNIVFGALVAVFLVFPISSLAIHDAGVEFPEWLAIGNTSSPIEGRKYTSAPELTTSTLLNGDFQNNAGEWISDAIPKRDDVILANAALQRLCIQAANIPLGYDCYPTYFGSTRIYTPRIDAFSTMPAKRSEKQLKRTCDTLAELRQLASDYPETEFVVYIVESSVNAKVNPAYKYCTNILLAEDLTVDISKAIGDVDNIHVMTNTCATEGGYYAEYYRTDHHWNSTGALRAFNEIADAVGIEKLSGLERIDFEGETFVGSLARWGLFLQGEPFYALKDNEKDLFVVNPDGTNEPYSHETFLKNTSSSRQFKFHDQYFEFIKTGSRIVNENAESESKALLVCDSYGSDLVPWLGMNFSSLDFVKDLHSDTKTDEESSLRSILQEGDYRYVFMVAGSTNYPKLASRSPHYFQ